MNLDRLLDKLLTEARKSAPSVRVPYAFEARIMHSIRTSARSDAAMLWARGLWRAVVPCVMAAAVAIAASITLLRPVDVESTLNQLGNDQFDGLDNSAATSLDATENSGEMLW